MGTKNDFDRQARELSDQAARGEITQRAAERMIGGLYLRMFGGGGFGHAEATERRRRRELRHALSDRP